MDRLPDPFIFATAEALAAQVSQENYDKGLIYPPFSNIRKISAHIAAKVATKAYDLGEFFENVFISSNTVLVILFFYILNPDFYVWWTGLASHLPRPKDLVKYAESCMYSPGYRSYR